MRVNMRYRGRDVARSERSTDIWYIQTFLKESDESGAYFETVFPNSNVGMEHVILGDFGKL